MLIVQHCVYCVCVCCFVCVCVVCVFCVCMCVLFCVCMCVLFCVCMCVLFCMCVCVRACVCARHVYIIQLYSYLITSCTARYQLLCLMTTTVDILLLLGEEVHQIDEKLLASSTHEALWMPRTGIPQLVRCSNIHIAILYWLETVEAHLESVYNTTCIILKFFLKTIHITHKRYA